MIAACGIYTLFFDILTPHTMSEIFNIENKIFTAVGDDPVKTKPFVPVPIPHDAVANGRIFPGRVIAGYNLPASSGLAFGAYMISQYEATPEAAGVYWCMGKKLS